MTKEYEPGSEPSDDQEIKELIQKISSIVDDIEDADLVLQELEARLAALEKAKEFLVQRSPRNRLNRN